MFKRTLLPLLKGKLFSGKAIVILGPRQSGKTTLANVLINESTEKSVVLNCDEPAVQALFEEISTLRWQQIIGDNKILFIDEAQRIENIGIKLKLVTDQFKEIQLIITGSSALELSNTINEPLTGRKWEYYLYPLSWEELKDNYSYVERKQQLELRLIYGMYPEIVSAAGAEEELLINLSGSYLYKDILSFRGIRKPELLSKLLRALALQLGSEVSYNELSRLLEVDKQTIENYISLLEKAFIITRLQPLSRNLRKEISSSRKIYFLDNGIRNAIISNFNPLGLRQDVGALWENFMISERIKANHYHQNNVNSYFWRTHDKQEIDLVEESGEKFHLFEFKWKARHNWKTPPVFVATYNVHESKLIHQNNFEEEFL